MELHEQPPPRSDELVRAALGPARRGYRRLLTLLLAPGWLAAALVWATLRFAATSHVGTWTPAFVFAGFWTVGIGFPAWWLTRRSLGDLAALLREGDATVAQVCEVVGTRAPRLLLTLADNGLGVVDIGSPAPAIGAEIPVLVGAVRPHRVVAITTAGASVGPRLLDPRRGANSKR